MEACRNWYRLRRLGGRRPWSSAGGGAWWSGGSGAAAGAMVDWQILCRRHRLPGLAPAPWSVRSGAGAWRSGRSGAGGNAGSGAGTGASSDAGSPRPAGGSGVSGWVVSHFSIRSGGDDQAQGPFEAASASGPPRRVQGPAAQCRRGCSAGGQRTPPAPTVESSFKYKQASAAGTSPRKNADPGTNPHRAVSAGRRKPAPQEGRRPDLALQERKHGAGMPLEVSELFSMGPLARGCHSTDYTIPKGFNMGPANVRRLQDQLVSRFDSLATVTNSYCNAEGKAAYFGFDAFKATMDKCKNSIRTTRDAAVKLMTAIYNEGHKPLPPEKSLDRDVARILQESLMSVAAVPTRTTARSNEDAESSAAAEDRCFSNSAVCSNPTAGTLSMARTNSFLRSVPRVKAKTKSSHDSSSHQTIKSCQSKPSVTMGRKAPVSIKSIKKIKFTTSGQVQGAAPVRSNEDAESSAAAEDRCLGNPAVCSNPTAGTLPTAGTNSFLRSVPRVKAKTKSSHDSSSNQTIKSCQSKPTPAMGRKAPVNIKSIKKIKFTISRQVKGAASIRSKSPRIMTRGAAARARAEVAWDTRARSESLESARIVELSRKGGFGF